MRVGQIGKIVREQSDVQAIGASGLKFYYTGRFNHINPDSYIAQLHPLPTGHMIVADTDVYPILQELKVEKGDTIWFNIVSGELRSIVRDDVVLWVRPGVVLPPARFAL